MTTRDPHGFTIFARVATSGGIFTDSGGVAVTARGVCWSTSPVPTLSDPRTSDGQFAIDYTSTLTGLLPNTLYYVRAYAINAVDTGYGNIDTFTTALQTTEIIVNPSTLSFGNVVINTTSGSLSFTVSGYILSPASDSITITAPPGFQVSVTNGSGYANSITIPYTGGTLNPTTIYVKLTPTTYGPFSGNITVTGGTAASQTVVVSGYGVQSPGDFSNRGTDFWVGYATHNLMYDNATDLSDDGGDQTMVLYFTSDVSAIVSVTIPGLGQTIASGLAVPANTVQSVVVPKSLGGTLPPNSTQLYREGLFNSAIHIVSDNGVPIVAYAHIYGNLVSGASLLLPTNTWSTQYYAISTPQATTSGSSQGSYNYFFVVAKEDGTQIEITPTVNTLGGLLPGQVTTVTLNKGQIYNVLATKVGNEDVTGSYIKSLDCSKKIAVFSGSGRTGINSGCNTSPSSDNLFQQVFPSVVWGTKYLTSRTIGTVPENVFRICVKDPATTVTVNGVPISTAYPGTVLTNNFFYQFKDSLPVKIESTKPVMVAQYCTSVQGCTSNGVNVNGDPEMILISPVQQAIKSVTLYSPANQNISFPFINVVIPKTGVSSFTLGGVNQSSMFVQHPQDTGYAYASFSNTDGVALNSAVTLSSSIGFTAIAYGFADATQGGSNPRRESYGYNAGTQLNDLSNPILIQNPYGNPINSAEKEATTCLGTSFRLAATLPYETNKITFSFLGNSHISPNADTTLQVSTGNLIFDSSFIVNGQTFYVYRLATTYTFDAVGEYVIQVTSFNPTSADGGCPGGSDKTINYTIKVVDGIFPDFSINYNSCVSDTVRLTDLSDGLGYTVNQWHWSYNSGSTPLASPSDTLQNPVVVNPTGNTNYTLRAVNNIGCYADTTKPLPGGPTPTVTFSAINPVCSSAPAFALTGGSPATQTGVGTGVYSGTGVSGGNFDPSVAGAGTHTLTYTYTTQAGCAFPVTQNIVVSESATLSIAQVPELCSDGEPITLVPNVTGGVFTGTGVSGNTFNPSLSGAGTFIIGYSIPSNDCAVSDTVHIVVNQEPCKPCVDPPRAFTPNGDGFNDKWILITGSCAKVVNVNVYNRWGGLVYSNNQYSNQWDGTYKGKPLPDGTYYYLINVHPQNAASYRLTGNVTIMR
ncbi:MAG: gliding motility-associated C-terminal domain-containing protein [Bacteroidota bacterium]